MSNNPETTPRTLGESMPALATAFVDTCKAAGVALDYLPRTLPIAEKFVKGAPAESERMAAYLGEVIRRETNGFWFDSGGTAMVYVGIDPYIDPHPIVRTLIAGGKPEVGGTTVDSSKAYCEQICRLQRQWLDQAVLGSYNSISALRTSMSADAKTAGIVLTLAQQAVLTAQLDWSESIDVSTDSLDAIERILNKMHHLSKSDPTRVTTERIESTSKPMGILVGEIVRRQYGGQWRISDAGTFELPYPGTTLDPVGRVRKRIVDGPAENVKMYFSSMAKVIAS